MSGSLSVVSSYVGLLTIVNPLITLPLFLALTEGMSPKRQRRVATVAGVTVVVVLIAGLLFGKWVLKLLGIYLAAFRIAGAAVILALAWSLITSRPSPFTPAGGGDRPVSVVPIGFPSLAGPGALTLVISYSTVASGIGDYARGVAVIGLVAATAAIVLVCAPVISRALTPVGIDVFSRVFGILLLAIAIGTLLQALRQGLPGLDAT